MAVLISLPCVSAMADNQTDFESQVCGIMEEETLTDENTDVGNFTDLGELISQSENELTLDKNYKFNSSTDKDFDGFTISKDNYVVDGQGHTIDGSGQVRIFIFTGPNITLKNINIINAKGTNGPAAWFTSLKVIDNCSFINNSASGSGGAIYIDNSVSNCKINSTFMNNSANNGGAIYFNGQTTNITINGYFESNVAERGAGAIYLKGKSSNSTLAAEFYYNHAKAASGGAIFFINQVDNNQFESIFRYNRAAYGAGIFFYNKANNNRFNSDFRFNVADSCGGAMFFHNTTNNNNFTGYFINNTALGIVSAENGNGGAITFKDTSSNSVFTCDFVNNTAVLYGGGVNYRQTPHNITFNSNFINNNGAKYGGGVNFFESFEGVVFNGEFNGNSAEYGGAICTMEGTIEHVSFKNNHAESGGAIYFDKKGDVINSNFTNNTANNSDDSDGGAICFNGNGTVIGCEFSNNSARYYGGAVYIWGDGTIKDSIFNSSKAQSGGSLYVHGAFEMDNCNFTNNNARTGGAIESWKNGIIEGSNFNNNVAIFGGGAIYSNNDIKLSDCNFTANSANENTGGAVYIFGFGEFNHTNFADNEASSYRGAIYFNNNGTIDQSTFTNNSANDGGAILTHGNITISNSKFADNVATRGTNHVSLKDNATITLINVVPEQLRNLNVSNITYGDIVKISSNVYDENNFPLNNGTLSVIIDGKEYSTNVSNGTATLEIPNLDAGNYNVDVKYIGNQRVAISSVSFTVFKQNAVISANNRAYIINYGGKYSMTLKDLNGKVVVGEKITFKLNGKVIGSAVTDAKGVATISITAKALKSAKAGKKNMVITTSGNYNADSKTVKITINKEKTKIAAKNKKFKKFKKIKKYTITLKNSKGKAVKKVKVTLKVKGKTYTAKTNAKGKATFKIKKLVKKGKHKATIKFKGNAYYLKSTKKVKITVK